MLTAYEIRRHCYFSQSYHRGQEIYYKGQYQILQIEQKNEGEPISVIATVKGSGTARYNTRVTVSADGDEIEDCYCDCPSYQQTECLCKHCVAIAIAYQAEQKKNFAHKTSDPIPINPRQKTSDPHFIRLLQRFQGVDRKSESFETAEQIDLVPVFSIDYSGKLSVEFQLGVKRMYVVKDIPGLLAAVEQHAKVRYGKNLEFFHTPEAFTPEARRWLEILKQILAVEQHIHDLTTRSIVQSSYSSLRTLNLGAYGMEQCLSYYLDTGHPLPGLNKLVVSGDPPLTLVITGGEQGATLSLEKADLKLFPISRRMFFIVKDTIYCCSEDFSRPILPLLTGFGIGTDRHYAGNRQLFMASSDYRDFCRYVLPKIEPCLTVIARDFSIQSYRPLPARMYVYLSMPDGQEGLAVEAKCSVFYGDEEFDLLDGSTAHKKLRDAEAEQKMGRLLKQYLPDHPEGLRCEGEEHILTLIQEGIPCLQEQAELMIDQKVLDIRVNPFPKITFGVSLGNGLLALRIDSGLLNPQEISEVLRAYRLKKNITV